MSFMTVREMAGIFDFFTKSGKKKAKKKQKQQIEKVRAQADKMSEAAGRIETAQEKIDAAKGLSVAAEAGSQVGAGAGLDTKLVLGVGVLGLGALLFFGGRKGKRK